MSYSTGFLFLSSEILSMTASSLSLWSITLWMRSAKSLTLFSSSEIFSDISVVAFSCFLGNWFISKTLMKRSPHILHWTKFTCIRKWVETLDPHPEHT